MDRLDFDLTRRLLEQVGQAGFDSAEVLLTERAMTEMQIDAGELSMLRDIRKLCDVESEGITGCITGRAIYEGTLDFAEALKVAAGEAQA